MSNFEESTYDAIEVAQIEAQLSLKPWRPGTRKIDYVSGLLWIFDGTAWQIVNMGLFTIGGTLLNPSAGDIYVWTAPWPCTVLAVKAYQDAGTGTTFNAFKGTLASPVLFLPSNVPISQTDALFDGGPVQNASVAAGTDVYIRLTIVSGSPNKVAVRIYLQRSG